MKIGKITEKMSDNADEWKMDNSSPKMSKESGKFHMRDSAENMRKFNRDSWFAYAGFGMITYVELSHLVSRARLSCLVYRVVLWNLLRPALPFVQLVHVRQLVLRFPVGLWHLIIHILLSIIIINYNRVIKWKKKTLKFAIHLNRHNSLGYDQSIKRDEIENITFWARRS